MNKNKNKIMNKVKTASVLICTIMLSLFLYSCSGNTGDNSNASNITIDDAIKVSEAYAPKDTVMTETKEDDGVYEISFANKDNSRIYEFDVNKANNGIVQIELSTMSDEGSVDVNISSKQVEKIIRDKFVNLTNININLEQDDGYFIYDINFTTEKFHGEAEINPKNGKVMDMNISYLAQNVYSDEDFNIEKAFATDANVQLNNQSANSSNNNSTAKNITVEKAKKLVLDKLPGCTITEIELDTESGNDVYEGEAVKDNYEYDFEIDGKTGKFIKWHQELID